MINIELELVSDVNLDQAFCIVARTPARAVGIPSLAYISTSFWLVP